MIRAFFKDFWQNYGTAIRITPEGWTGSKGSRRGKNSKRKERQGEGNADSNCQGKEGHRIGAL